MCLPTLQFSTLKNGVKTKMSKCFLRGSEKRRAWSRPWNWGRLFYFIPLLPHLAFSFSLVSSSSFYQSFFSYLYIIIHLKTGVTPTSTFLEHLQGMPFRLILWSNISPIRINDETFWIDYFNRVLTTSKYFNLYDISYTNLYFEKVDFLLFYIITKKM